MIGRLLHIAVVLFASFCVATVLAQVIILGYSLSHYQIDGEKLARMMAVAQGLEAAPAKQPGPPPVDTTAAEQATFDQILETRAVKSRNLELRDQSVRNRVNQILTERSKLAAERDEFEKVRLAFAEGVSAVQKQATAAGWEQIRQTLAALKPKQSKELLLQMLAKNETETVAALLAPMADNKRAKIIAEFKTPEEVKKIDDILRLIREGDPSASIAASAQRQLGAAGTLPQGTPR